MASVTGPGSQEGGNEEFRLVRAFSNSAADDGSEMSEVLQAVRDHTNEEEQSEALRLRKYFNNVELSR